MAKDIRAMPNVESMAPWLRSEALIRSMSHNTWQSLTPHAQRLSRHIVCDEGESVVGEGFTHPRRSERERHRAAAFEAMDPSAAEMYRRRG